MTAILVSIDSRCTEWITEGVASGGSIIVETFSETGDVAKH